MKSNLFIEECLAQHCSFKIGGVTPNFCEPDDIQQLTESLTVIKEKGYEPVICGYGANTLFPDYPRDTTCFISLTKLNGFYRSGTRHEDKNCISLMSGTPLSFLAILGVIIGEDYDFTYLLPGSLGAGVYMNARYWDMQMSYIVKRVHYVDIDAPQQGVKSISAEECEFDYKQSVFQRRSSIIAAVDIEVNNQSAVDMLEKIYALAGTDCSQNTLPEDGYSDIITAAEKIVSHIKNSSSAICDIANFYNFFAKVRRKLPAAAAYNPFEMVEDHRLFYRHFDFPSAGSVFQNSRELGKPVGAIIDELKLKGTLCGGAMISPFHGNIIINFKKAKSTHVLKLIDIMTENIFKAYCFEPELELKIIKGSSPD